VGQRNNRKRNNWNGNVWSISVELQDKANWERADRSEPSMWWCARTHSPIPRGTVYHRKQKGNLYTHTVMQGGPSGWVLRLRDWQTRHPIRKYEKSLYRVGIESAGRTRLVKTIWCTKLRLRLGWPVGSWYACRISANWEDHAGPGPQVSEIASPSPPPPPSQRFNAKIDQPLTNPISQSKIKSSKEQEISYICLKLT
jgi:hypothetical protein